VWGIHLPETELEHRLEYASLVADPDATVWLGFYKGEPAGMQCYFPAEYADDYLFSPPDCIELAVACTKATYRGLGIGGALTRHGLAVAREAGYRRCLVDWRSTSLIASTFWPAHGFQPVIYRLVRRVDSRIAWGR
jgi:GNAT superfamily N-acetyltransferase